MNAFKKRTVVVVGVIAALVIGGVAFAYWTNTGSGTGSASTGSNDPIVVNQTSTVTDLRPGSGTQALSGDFTNLNTSPVYVGSVEAAVSGTDKAGCDADDYTIAGTATVNAQVPTGTNVSSWSGLTIEFNNLPTTNQDACKGAIVDIAYTSN